MLRLVFVGCILLVGLVAAIKSRFGALLLYIWFALFRPQEWVWTDITALRLSVTLGLLLVVPSLLTGIMPTVTHPLSVGAMAFLVSALVAQRNAIDAELGWYWCGFLAKLIVVCLFLITLTSTRKRLVALLAVISGSFGFYTAKAGAFSILAGGSRYREGLAGAFSDNNGYALAGVMIMYLLIGTAQNISPRWLSRMFWAAVPLTAMTVVSTFSRAGFLALMVSLVVYLLLQRRRLVLLLAMVVLVPLGALVIPIPAGYVDRLRTITRYEEIQETSALSRLNFWRVALKIASERPLGIGLWNFESVYDSYDATDGLYGRRRAVHNSFLQALVETGWIGGVFFAGMFAVALRICFRLRARSRDPALPVNDQRQLFTTANALVASIAAFVVGGTFVSAAYTDLIWFVFGTVAAADRLSVRMCHEAADAHALAGSSVGA